MGNAAPHTQPTRKECIEMKSVSVSVLILSVALMASTFALAADQSKVDQERQEIRKRTKEILAQLYKAEPKAKANVQKAAGYAVDKA